MEGLRCVVTGSSGFCGTGLVKALVDKGAAHVVGFDWSPLPPHVTFDPKKVTVVQGDIRNADQVSEAIAGADIVFHLAAVVGTFHPTELFEQVNIGGTENVLAACKKHGVKRLVHSSTPSTRFHGVSVRGMDIKDMTFPETFVAEYARTKAAAEKLVMAACSDDLLVVAVMPHQVYGTGDTLFLPQLMYTAKIGKLRVFGSGENEISICHLDNYMHGLLLAAEKLVPGSPIVGRSYLITDGGKYKLWDMLEEGSVFMGYGSVKEKIRVPWGVMMFVATISEMVGRVQGTTPRINRFTVKMLMIDRWFDITSSEQDLGYSPVRKTAEAWPATLQYFKENEEYYIQLAMKLAGVKQATKSKAA